MRPIQWHKKRKKAGMPPTAELVMDLIIDSKPMPVMDVINHAWTMKIASSSTLHNSLSWLKNNGYVKVLDQDTDGRKRVCVVTDKAKNYLGVINGT